MKPANLLFAVLILFIGGGTLIVLSMNAEKSERIKDKQQDTDLVRWKQVPLERLADELNKCTDSSYFARYFSKGSRFSVYSLKNDTLDERFQTDEKPGCLQDAFATAKQIGVQSIHNNRKDSFYRFQLRNESGNRIPKLEVYVLRHPTTAVRPFPARLRMQKVSQRVYYTFQGEE